MLSSHVKGWRCGKLMSIQQVGKPALCFNQDHYSQQQKWMFKSISRCLVLLDVLQTHQPHDLMFSFLYISTTQWQMWRFQFSNSSFPQERWKWSPTSPASATSAAASPRCIQYTVEKFYGWNPNMKLWKMILSFSSKWFFFGSMLIFQGFPIGWGCELHTKKIQVTRMTLTAFNWGEFVGIL